MTQDAARESSTQTPAGRRYAAFISYRHTREDRRWATWLHAKLETYRVPRRLAREKHLPRRIGRVFRDEEELPASASLSAEIDEALRDSDFLIVICSPRTPESLWVGREIDRFRELGRHDRILALLIEGEPEQSFPRALVELRKYREGVGPPAVQPTEALEPLAADVRPSAEEPSARRAHTAKLRLLAKILGVRYDDLRQREQERRGRSLGYATAFLALLSTILIGLSAAFLTQRNLARERATLAEQRRQDAERNLWTASDQRSVTLRVLNDMVFALGSELRDSPVSLDARRKLLAMAGDGLRRLDGIADDPLLSTERTSLFVRIQLGELHQQAGEWKQARSAFEDALERARRRAAFRPKDALAQRDLVAALLCAGGLSLHDLHDMDEAGARLRTAVALCETLRAAHPGHAGSVESREMTAARLALGDWMLERGDAACLTEYRSALDLWDGAQGTTARTAPPAAEAGTITRLAAAHLRFRASDEAALANLRTRLRSVLQSMAAEANRVDPAQGARLAQERTAAMLCLAKVERQLGDCHAALQAATIASMLVSELARMAPSRVDWQVERARALFVAGECHELCGEASEASAAFGRALSALEEPNGPGRLDARGRELLEQCRARVGKRSAGEP